MTTKSLSDKHLSLDAFLGGKLKLFQPKQGYRFSIDSILLADFVSPKATDRIIELGTGAGIIPLLLHYNKQFHSILAVEIQDELVAIAQKNITLNGAEDRIEIIHADFRQFVASYGKEKFDIVISNPPYRKLHSGRLNPQQGKAIARHEISCTLEELIATTAKLLSSRGHFGYIYPAFRLGEMLIMLKRHKLSANKLCFVHPQAGREATHFLIDGGFTSPLNLKVLPPLFVFNPDGSYTNKLEQILQSRI